MIYSINNKRSFKDLEHWVAQIEMICKENVPIVVVATKCDLVGEQEVSEEEGKEFANKINSKFIITSSKINMNVDRAFELLTEQAIEKYSNNENESNKIKLGNKEGRSDKDNPSNSSCC